MNTSDILSLRLYNQQLITNNRFKEPAEIVAWMGAMQSQTLEMAKWAIGVRLPGTTVNDIEDSLNNGRIIRTHILRPTWHFVSAKDIHWMFDLSNPRIKPIYISYCKLIEADEQTIISTYPIIEKTFAGGNHFTKPEIQEILQQHGIKTDDRWLNMIISRAEMEGIICNGKLRGSKQTFTLLHEWVPKKYTLSKEESLERLARRFFTSHSPATVEDFAWWSGLTITECRQALQLIKDDFISEDINGRTFWLKNDFKIPEIKKPSVLLLPPFDEYVVSYKNRSEIVEDVHYNKVMTKNGLFDPTMMLNGEIIGKWKKKTVKKGAQVDLTYFVDTTKKVQALFDKEAKRVEAFYKKE
ncbi:MAG: winged helix DNA-binding domain-containing protein [Tannerella sp.]|jgi:hypothetical protein|nr:winged helix DNA-binding domain-containing protein [Tannerella sp.]